MRQVLTGIGTPSLVTLALVLAPAASGAQEPSLAEVLTRATDYVTALSNQLSGMVAEERYEQRSMGPATSRPSGVFPSDTYERRTLRSDYLLIQPEGSEQYFGFRDVFEVDGRPVRDREDRLSRLFLDSSVSTQERAQGILADSARYNIGDVQRNVNTPTLALLFLRPAHKSRVEFERVTDTSPRLGLREPEEVADVWVVAYEEVALTTVVRSPDGGNLPAHGRFWIAAETGQVLVSELIFDNFGVDATITVRYEAAETMGHPVPVEMRERYENRAMRSHVEGTATYTRFRRFQVQVEESVPVPD